MPTISAYRILTAESSFELEGYINDFMKYGWQPLGSVTVTAHSIWAQTMVMYE